MSISRRPMRTAALATTALVPALMLAGCGGSGNTSAGDSPATSSPTPSPAVTAAGTTCHYPSDGRGSAGKKVTPPSTTPVSGTVTATMHTSVGDIGLSLDADKAPCTVTSFVSLAKQGFFDKTSCHRLTTEGIKVLQCGDPSGTGSGGPGYTFADELRGAQGLVTDQKLSTQAGRTIKTYPAGTLAMANAGANTNGSQFFLVYADSPLPPDYSVFGTIGAKGVKEITQAAKAGTDNSFGPGDGHPKTAVDITSVSVG